MNNKIDCNLLKKEEIEYFEFLLKEPNCSDIAFYLKNLTEKMKNILLEENSIYFIQSLTNPTAEERLKAIKSNPSSIKYIDNLTEEEKLMAICYADNVKEIYTLLPNPGEDVQIMAVKKDREFYIDTSNQKVRLAMVQANGFRLEYLKEPTTEERLAAVKQNGFAIRYIDESTEKEQLEAVKEDPLCLIEIKKPFNDVIFKALSFNPATIKYVKNPTNEMLQYSAKLDKCNL